MRRAYYSPILYLHELVFFCEADVGRCEVVLGSKCTRRCAPDGVIITTFSFFILYKCCGSNYHFPAIFLFYSFEKKALFFNKRKAEAFLGLRRRPILIVALAKSGRKGRGDKPGTACFVQITAQYMQRIRRQTSRYKERE